jgi:glyoxylase-like metal-dependent hydrolase (beta-lactamase superfamily II)
MAPLKVEPVLSDESTMMVTASLVVGQTGVMVVDAGFTLDQGEAIADRVAATGLPLTAILITHEHPDHYFGAKSLLARWPAAQLLAAPQVVAGIEATGVAKLAQWRANLGDRLPAAPTVPQPLTAGTVELDGEVIEVLSLGQGDCAHNTAVHVPSAHTIITGDLAYSGTHVWLVETDPAARRAWQANLDRLVALNATTVIAGHMTPGSSTGPEVLTATSTYLDVFDDALTQSNDGDFLLELLIAAYPDHALRLIAQLSAQAAFPAEH